MLNEKHEKKRRAQNVANMVIISNNMDPFKVEVDDRRYLFIQPTMPKDPQQWFDSIHNSFKHPDFYDTLEFCGACGAVGCMRRSRVACGAGPQCMRRKYSVLAAQVGACGAVGLHAPHAPAHAACTVYMRRMYVACGAGPECMRRMHCACGVEFRRKLVFEAKSPELNILKFDVTCTGACATCTRLRRRTHKTFLPDCAACTEFGS